MDKQTPITAKGAERLSKELHELKTKGRQEMRQALAEARAHGDLKENAEYHAAKEKQSFMEGRIAEIESKLANARVIDVTTFPETGRVIFGATVHLLNIDTEKESVYQIVGEDEADIQAGKISNISPIARGIIGKEEGDEVEVQTPAGIATYEIVKVEYI